MTDYAPWLRELAAKGGKHTVSNIDARSLGRIADEIERDRSARLRDIAEIKRLQEAKRAALTIADERSRENVGLRAALKPFAEIALVRDKQPSLPDMIDAPDLAITPANVRAARQILADHDLPTAEDVRGILSPSAEFAAENARLRTLIDRAADYMAVCAIPSMLNDTSRAELNEVRAHVQLDAARRRHEQNVLSEKPK